jgi:integrase
MQMRTLPVGADTQADGLATAPDRNPVVIYLARLSPRSRRTYSGDLAAIARVVTGRDMAPAALDRSGIRYTHAQAIRTALAERYSPASANRMLAALRGVLQEAWRLGLLTAEEFERACDLSPVRGQTLPAGRSLASGELRALFEACRGKLGARDAALLSICYGAGLRRSEAVALDLADFDPESGSLAVRHGKGNKERIAYASNGALAALKAWVSIRGCEAGPLFVPVAKGGLVGHKRLTDAAVFRAFSALGRRAGVASFTPHDLRRTFISDLLDAGADIATVAHLAGHANVRTTARYDRRPEATKRRASSMLHVPYVTSEGNAK